MTAGGHHCGKTFFLAKRCAKKAGAGSFCEVLRFAFVGFCWLGVGIGTPPKKLPSWNLKITPFHGKEYSSYSKTIHFPWANC